MHAIGIPVDRDALLNFVGQLACPMIRLDITFGKKTGRDLPFSPELLAAVPVYGFV